MILKKHFVDEVCDFQTLQYKPELLAVGSSVAISLSLSCVGVCHRTGVPTLFTRARTVQEREPALCRAARGRQPTLPHGAAD